MHNLDYACFVCLFLFNALAIVFWLYLGGDVIYVITGGKPGRTLLSTQGIFNLSPHVGMVWEELVFDDAVSYTQKGNGLQQSKMS